jgi:Family of unknown function (DUF5719)
VIGLRSRRVASERGRRSAGGVKRGWSRVAVATVCTPLVVALALATLRPAPEPAAGGAAPTATPMAATDLICPTPFGTDPRLLVSQASPADSAGDGQTGNGAGGKVTVGPVNSVDDSADSLELTPGGVVTAPRPTSAHVIAGSGSRAAGLTASLVVRKPLAGIGCGTPQSDQWFTGLGAGPTHSSQLELVNPDTANAVADVTVFGEQGIIDVPDLRGVAVPPRSRTVFKLAEVLPQRGQLGLRVRVSRGRLGAYVSDRSDELGGATSVEWMPAQAEPARRAVLLGLPRGRGQHRLVVTNPGPDVSAVSVRVSTPSADFAPTGLAPVQIPPESVGVIALTDVIQDAVGPPKGGKKLDPDQTGLGLIVEASEPVGAVLRSLADDDLSFTGSHAAITHGWAPIPKPIERAALMVGGVAEPAKVTVRFVGGQGGVVATNELSVPGGATKQIEIPEKTAAIDLQSKTGFSAAVLMTGKSGDVVMSVPPVATDLLVPHTRPTLR